MIVTWFGHAAFALEGEIATGKRRRVILDPYNYPGCGGYLPVDESADVVCVSHDNPRYHSDVSAIRGSYVLVRALEHAGSSVDAAGVRIYSHEVREDADGNGPNAMVRIELDGITVAHLGDLGHRLEGTALGFLEGTDVLLALAGGTPTIALDDLRVLIDAIRPSWVIPMHFKTPKVDLRILGLDSFLAAMHDLPIDRPGVSTIELSRESLPSSTRVLVLEHAR
jgi:L-ascorbate metabolism protein UlaG (beta-lactamase superfamily)